MNNKSKFEFHPSFVLRTPRLSFQEYSSLEDLQSLIQQDFIREAIYIASPSLHNKIEQFLNLKESADYKLITSIYKYINRMSTRPTPFGMFAGCSTSQWDEETTFSIQHDLVIRKTKFSLSILNEIAEIIQKNSLIKPYLTFYLNTTIYKQLNITSYFEKVTNSSNNQKYKISEVENSVYLSHIIKTFDKSEKLTLEELSNCFIRVFPEFSREEVEEYIDSLVDTQILVSTILPDLNTENYLENIIVFMSHLPSNKKLEEIKLILDSINKKLKELDNSEYNQIINYEELYSLMDSFGVKRNSKSNFNVSLFKKEYKYPTVDKVIQNDIIAAAEILNTLIPNKKNNSYITSFIQTFYERYEHNEIPILEAFNSNIGIVISDKTSNSKNNNKQGSSLFIDTYYRFLHKMIVDSYKENTKTIRLDDIPIPSFLKKQHSFSNLYTVFFSLFSSPDCSEYIYLKSISPSDPSKLLGRFAPSNDKIRNIISDVYINKKTSPFIYANILFLPEKKGGEVVSHSILHDYYISCFGYYESNSNQEKINLSDIMVSVNISEQRIFLRSISKNKYIIPVLGNAHNYRNSNFPLYRFLCEVEHHYDNKFLSFNWGPLSKMFSFFPRVQYKKIVISRATWILYHNDYEELLTGDISKQKIQEWLKKYNIPNRCLLIEGDNELLINFEHNIAVMTFISEIKKTKKIVLQEFLFNAEHCPIKDSEGNSYTNELIATFYQKHNEKLNTFKVTQINTSKNDNKYFLPYSEWTYFKIYCNETNVDYLLLKLLPIINKLTIQKKIEKWFFIRYYDSSFHIRLRIKYYGKFNEDVFQLLNSKLNTLLQKKYFWNLQVDTYKPELKRYGYKTISECESIFFYDSITITILIKKRLLNTPAESRYYYALFSIDYYLRDFKIYGEDAMKFSLFQFENYSKEFDLSKSMKIQLDSLYRKLLTKSSLDIELRKILDKRSKENSFYINNIYKGKNLGFDYKKKSLVGSIIHMSMNRLFENNQRYHEMVVYYYFYKYAKSNIMKEKYANKSEKDE